MTTMVFENIRIVMVATTHPGNIGAAARAMKTMGQENLYLVNPKIFPSAAVTARATGADDILANAVVCDSLAEAIKDCVLVVATSARSRNIAWPTYEPRDYAAEMLRAAVDGQVAILFGRESSGLANDELEYCHTMLQIPANEEFSSLNVASAVQIICYELLYASLASGHNSGVAEEGELVTAEQMQQFYEHLEACMTDIGFYDPEKPKRLMRRMKRLFNRARPDQNEMNILRGLLAAAQDAARGGKN